MFDALNIRLRLAVVYGLLGALALVIAGLGIWAAYTQQAAFVRINHILVKGAALGNEARTALQTMRRYEKDIVINVADSKKREEYLAHWLENAERAKQALAAVQERVLDPTTSERMKRINEGFASYERNFKEAYAELEGKDTQAANDLMRSKAKPAFDATDAALGEVLASIDGFMEKAKQRLRGLFDMVWQGILVAVFIGSVLVVWLGRRVSRSITGPLRRAEDFAAAVKDGDLTGEIEVKGSDECARLSLSLQAMQSSLQQIVGQVRQAADSIQVASTEVASGNQDLSDRTEQTASSLQQTASSMNELTSTVNQTADAARTASQLASQASSSAERGGAVVGEVVSTMELITNSSRRISDIIGTIDGIAFQTNILALNAAVEAARAGEAGRGFAVVAGEVRLLAQRSADAAKEIKSLINASVESVETGTRLVADAGSTMGEIVGNVQRVTDIIGEISAAAGEQSNGISTVNRSVSDLDQATQQNAALVEESAAAAQSLRDQAQKLSEVVATFKLPGGSMLSARAQAPKSAPTSAKPRPTPLAAKPAAAAAVKRSAAPAAPAPRPAAAPASGGDDSWETF